MTDRLRVATLNIRNLADRWDERLPLLLADTASVAPDLLGLQEVVYVLQQDRILGAAGAARYTEVRGWAGRPEYGNSLLVNEALSLEPVERLDLGLQRAAHGVIVTLAGGPRLLVAVTHLHHEVPDESQRDEQTAALLAWFDAAPATDARIVMGDFNAEPTEPTYARMRAAGWRSSFLEANGEEPAVTWPSGLQAPGMDTDGEPGCLDYIWLQGDVRAVSARLAWDRPAVGDPTLYPSDHVGIVAEIEVG
jgi:endonuclease/exonuclease/phosphatase family metal-dependent hydrolase